MSVSRFDPAEPLGPGRTIIEASAGTGKTFTIAALVARLVADGMDLDRILVVTFTRAATAELRGRVRRRLADSLRALDDGDREGTDDHLQVLLERPEPVRTEASARLRSALADFDRAQIFTIHGFAQRLLGQLGFMARLSETLQPGDVDDLLLNQVASDLVVSRFAHDPAGKEELKPGDVARIAREVMGHPDARVVPAVTDVDGLVRLRVEMGQAGAAEAQRRMRSAGAMTFDDGLLEVRDALTDADVGKAAGELLARRYDIGLVDESQDTDPIQWQIVRQVLEPTRLVVIGDPKQSIYAFRGADIESYLAAVRGASAHRTLDTNWRSDAPLVTALDLLFTGATFGHDEIQYRKVEPAAPGARIGGVGAALRLRPLDSDLPITKRKDGFFRVGECRTAVAADAAAEVVRLLNGDVTIEENGERRRLGPADIAVLCRKRSQVEDVRAELERRRVPSVAARTGAVLMTPAAEEWRRFLLAVERPDRMDLVRLAATTFLVGESLQRVAGLDDSAALDLQRQMREWHDTLQSGGVPALLAELNRHTGLAERILGMPDGERLMTDLTHIAEELHAVFRTGRHGSLAAWLETAIEEAKQRERLLREEPESRQRRLETDAEAVTVQTIHGAKGLQYPVVLVPYAWDVWIGDPPFPVFHDPNEIAGA
ncbi:MAG TPA: UvrD-helicase domain-containing protein, partial [Acidimicrobiia bacterium]|nr:UvrD-helicase domain-containing protein [Acidimicrobiia bacterium]